ncbi:MAG: hypothetical protein JWP25_7012 [Bradyrhizobium sp.]|nr:hypothetical protein [Bradyrhizobium sp.]
MGSGEATKPSGKRRFRSKTGLHRRQYRNVIKGALSPRFARMSLIDLMIAGTLNHRVPGSSPGAPTNPFKSLAV